MKKYSWFLLGFLFILYSGIAYADCTVTVNWTPSVDPVATDQEVWYDPDNTITGDENRYCFGDMTLNYCQFVISSPMPNDEIWIRTKNATDQTDTVHVPVGGVAGATNISVITICD